MRQDHDAAMRCRPGAAGSRDDRRRGDDGVRTEHLRPAEPAGHRDGLPELRDLAAHDRFRQRRVSAARRAQACAARRDRQPGAGSARDRGTGRPRGSQRNGAFRRTTATARPCAGARPAPETAAAGRAAQQPRRQASRSAPRRGSTAAAPPRHHHALRHARSGRGVEHVVPDRRAQPGRDRPGRHTRARSTSIRSRVSSRTSSGRATSSTPRSSASTVRATAP